MMINYKDNESIMETKINSLHTSPLTVHCDEKQIHDETKYMYILVTKQHALYSELNLLPKHG